MEQFMMDSHKLLGWGLIALGALVAYQNIIMRVLGDVMWRWGQNNPFFRAVYLMLDELPQIVACVALVICGVWLVRGPKGKKQKHDAPEDEDFREYAAAPQAAPEDTADFAMPERPAGPARDPGRRGRTARGCRQTDGGRRWTSRIRPCSRKRPPHRRAAR